MPCFFAYAHAERPKLGAPHAFVHFRFGSSPAPPISAALYNPYSWALLAVLLFSAFTGWNRKYAKDEAPAA